jgi:hypothetical protein
MSEQGDAGARLSAEPAAKISQPGDTNSLTVDGLPVKGPASARDILLALVEDPDAAYARFDRVAIANALVFFGDRLDRAGEVRR